MAWKMTFERGYLPQYNLTQSPLDFRYYDDIASLTPSLYREKRMRKVLYGLPEISDRMLASLTSKAERERVFLDLCYIGHAAYHENPQEPMHEFPANFARMFVRIAGLLEKIPVLSYDTYMGHNVQLKNPNGPIALGKSAGNSGNLELMVRFNDFFDEDWFVLVHAAIEATQGRGFIEIPNTQGLLLKEICTDRDQENAVATVNRNLNMMGAALRDFKIILARMTEACDPAVYYHGVRPQIFGFKRIKFSGVPIEVFEKMNGIEIHEDGTVTIRGETGAQSRAVPTYLAALDIRHKDSLLTEHLQAMCAYAPREHQKFIDEIWQNNERGGSMRKFVADHRDMRQLVRTYNACVKLLVEIRSLHFRFATDYITKQVANPEGTGGTPFMLWLDQLIKETMMYIIPEDPNAPLPMPLEA